MKWFKIHKNGNQGAIGRDVPPETGVGIASMPVPHINDPQLSLNYISIDGEVIGVDLCCHGQDRHKWMECAKRYAKSRCTKV